jgi:hypothetical protein
MVEVNEERSLKQLKLSYDMYEKTKKETEKRLKAALNEDGTRKYTKEDIDKEIKLIETAEQDIIDQYVQYGGNIDDLKKKKKVSNAKVNDLDAISKAALELMNEEEQKAEKVKTAVNETETRLEQEYIPKKGTYQPGANFDIINLPSKGEGYKDKIKKVSVSYLTAYDENMIVSPNLYRDNLILDYLINAKLMSKEIDPLDLLEGDRDAIILFLRMNGYGNEYPITATDNVTGKEFESVIDLSELKMKEFNLKGDSNGWFPFTLPESGVEVKFRFPTHRDTLILEKMKTAEDEKLRKTAIETYVNNLDTFIEAEKKLSADDKIKVRKAIRTLEDWAEKIDDNEQMFNKQLTNRLNLLIMAVDGITDRDYISNFIKTMRIKDSTALRKYIANNEPGIDYTIKVNRPEELGGGSFETFLQLDQFLFLNLAD